MIKIKISHDNKVEREFDTLDQLDSWLRTQKSAIYIMRTGRGAYIKIPRQHLLHEIRRDMKARCITDTLGVASVYITIGDTTYDVILIKDQLTTEEKTLQGQWRSVTEKPKDRQHIIVYELEPEYGCHFYDSEIYLDQFGFTDNAVAWMPIPEVPEHLKKKYNGK